MTMEVNCFKCNAPLAADDVNIQQAIAKCSKCQAVFRLDGNGRAHDRGQVSKPERISVRHIGSETIMTYRWQWLIAVILIPFSVFWNGITWTIVALMYLDGELNVSLALFMTPFVLVGVGSAYVAIAFLLNSTTLRATPSMLTIRHAPVPWFGNRRLDPVHIDQLSSHERIHQDKNGPSKTYELIAHMLDGKKVKLIKGLDKPAQALYLEQELEAALAIEDRPMPNEIPR
jgi:hypothetical protein